MTILFTVQYKTSKSNPNEILIVLSFHRLASVIGLSDVPPLCQMALQATGRV